MAQLVQLTSQSDRIRNLFKANSQRIMRAAPKSQDPNRLLAIAFNAIAYNTDLLQCSEQSLVGGVFESVKLGLTLGGPMQEAWLIPFAGQATLIIGYQGYRNLIDRSRAVMDLHPRAVHNGLVKTATGFEAGEPDEFDYWYGDEPRIIHKPRNAQPLYKDQLLCVYAVARLRGGGKQMEVLPIDEIEAHRNRSRAKNKGPWVDDYVPMAMKTAIRKIAKYLPKASLEMARALELDNQADAGINQDFETETIVIPPTEPPQPIKTARLEELKTELNGKPAAEPLTDADIPFGG